MSVTNNVVLIMLDDTAYQAKGQTRGHCDRNRINLLVRKLAADKCPLVVFDVLLSIPYLRPPMTKVLAAAMRAEARVLI